MINIEYISKCKKCGGDVLVLNEFKLKNNSIVTVNLDDIAKVIDDLVVECIDCKERLVVNIELERGDYE